MSWENQAFENQWIPLSTAMPQDGQRVQVFYHINCVWATWSAEMRAFVVGPNSVVLAGVTHWRKGPAQTDGLLASGDNGQLSD